MDLTIASKKLALDFDQKFQVLSQRIRKQRKTIDDLKRQLRLEQATKFSINQQFNNYGLLNLVGDLKKNDDAQNARGSFF